MSGIRAAGSVVRIVNLSFKLSGIKDETNAVQELTKAANQAITAIRIAKLAWAAFTVGIGPAGWIMLGASVLGEADVIRQEFTAKEEVGARGD